MIDPPAEPPPATSPPAPGGSEGGTGGADPRSGYQSPLSGRYASIAMQRVWSPRRKFEAWRALWASVAQAQHEAGLGVSAEQARALREHRSMTEADFARAQAHERRLRHDVMAHVHALGDAAPEARGIIHLGCTSQDVNCNTELVLIDEALELVLAKAARLVDALARFALRWRDLPCLAFTHYQAAQPTTVGKRAAVWGTDAALALEHLEQVRASVRFRGLKGATGTQASFLALLGDGARVEALEAKVVRDVAGVGPERVLQAVGQTYPRVIDTFVLGGLASLASVLHKLATDIRLLCGHKELDEPMEAEQIGSSAMPYKRNPMRSERACGLCRFVMSLPANAYDTAATQWLERTLDDSANRRLVLPEAFLALDGALDLMTDVTQGLIVHEGSVARNLASEMPFLASENLMMAAAALGRDRQAVHEAIRRLALEAARRIKDEGAPNDLLERLSREPLLAGVSIDAALDPRRYIGLAPRQVDRFIAEMVQPIRARWAHRWASLEASTVRV